MIIDHQSFIRSDGRSIDFYASSRREYRLFEGLSKPAGVGPHLRWHPLRQEWVAYAGARQDRTFLPASSMCPLCPMASPESPPTDIPTDDFEVAIFTNRFAAFEPAAGAVPPDAPASSQPAHGSCQVLCYSPDHHLTLADLSAGRRRLVLEAIAHKTDELYGQAGIELVLPFENVGKEIGVTLEHPHGQIYALGVLPTMMQRQAEAMDKRALSGFLKATPQELVLTVGAHSSLLVPYCARYPYEMWLVPHQGYDHLGQMPREQRQELADLLGLALAKLSALFDQPLAYTLAWYFAPKAAFGSYHCYLAIQPLRRDSNKLKFLAGVEQSSGLFLVDVLPELAAQRLRPLG